MYEVRDLRMVLAIHQHGSLARAARILGVAQPVLTRQLAALEARVRGPLFDRGPRGAIVTDLGRVVIALAGDILERLDALGERTAEVRGDQVRDLNVAAGAYMAETLCITAASRMVGLYPRIRIRIAAANWAEVPAMIHGRQATVGLLDLRSMNEDPALHVEPLRPQPGFFVARPGHPLAGRRDIALADILAYPVVFIGRVPGAIQAPMAAARAEARLAGRIHPAFPAIIEESPTMALTAVAQSNAVAAVTPGIARAALRSASVVGLRWREPWLSVHPGIVHLKGHALREAELAFLDLLRDAEREADLFAADCCAGLGLSAACG